MVYPLSGGERHGGDVENVTGIYLHKKQDLVKLPTMVGHGQNHNNGDTEQKMQKQRNKSYH